MHLQQSSELLAALYRGDERRAAALLAESPQLDLFEAAACGRAEVVRDLLARRPQAAMEFTSDGFSALHLVAFFSGDLQIARLLLAAGADPAARSRNAMEVTPLGSAAARSQREIVRLLLVQGADVDATQKGGYTALHSAAAAGDGELVELLLHHGADPRRSADDGRTPATLAAAGGHSELAAHLESIGAKER